MRHYRLGPRVTAAGESLLIPDMAWLGLRSGDIAAHDLAGESAKHAQSRLPLSARDRAVAAGMLQTMGGVTRGFGAQAFGRESDLMAELQRMLVLGYKVEIQAVDDVGDVSRWLGERLRERMG
jgi:hypothetical protein